MAHTVFTQYINENENNMEAELAFDASFFKANRKVDSPTFIEKLSIFQLFAQKKACTLNGDFGPLGKTRKKHRVLGL